MMGSVQTHTKESPLTELFSELKLIVLGFLDARSLHAMLWVNRAFHELIESKEGQIGLWLPLLSQHLRYDAEETRRLFPVWEENWKQGFVELISVPIIDSEGYNHGRFEVTDLRTAKMYNHVETYSNARAIKPILPHCSFYFEVFVQKNSGSVMVGIMTNRQPLDMSIPTQNFYHGLCVNHFHYQKLEEPRVGVHVISGEDNVILHFFVNGTYTHSRKLRADIYYPAISAHSVGDQASFVRPIAIPSIPSGLVWPGPPFAEYEY